MGDPNSSAAAAATAAAESAFEEAALTLRSCTEYRDLLAESSSLDRPLGVTAGLGSSSSSPALGEAPARCRPWSEADYFQRLRTFSPQTWFGKSLQASPPRCAAHGWVNAGMDTLACQICRATLVIESDVDAEATPDVASDAHHAPSCPWVGQACPPEVTQFPLATPEALLARTAHGYQGCRRLLAHYGGQLGVTTPEDLTDLLARLRLPLAALVRRLQRECGAGVEEEGGGSGQQQQQGQGEQAVDDVDAWAAVLAVHGWEALHMQTHTSTTRAASASPGAPSGNGWVLACGLCGRRVEAWRVVSRRGSASMSPAKGSGGVGEDRASGRLIQQQAEAGGGAGAGAGVVAAWFDPVEQHRYYCPWTALGLRDAGEKGWQRTAKVVASRVRPSWLAPRGGADGGEAGQAEGEAEALQWLATGLAAQPGNGAAERLREPEEVYRTAMNLLRSF